MQLCQENILVIANGRTPGDMLGNFTCYDNRGASVVDYVICDRQFFKACKGMKVEAPMFSSAHTPIGLTLNCRITHKANSKKPPSPQLQNLFEIPQRLNL